MIFKKELKTKSELQSYVTSIQVRKAVILENANQKDMEELFRKKLVEIDTKAKVLIIST